MKLVKLHDKDLNGIIIVDPKLCKIFDAEMFALFPFIIISDADYLDLSDNYNRVAINHERIHLSDQKKFRNIKPNSVNKWRYPTRIKYKWLFLLKYGFLNRKMLWKYYREYRQLRKKGYSKYEAYYYTSFEIKARRYQNVGYYLNIKNLVK